MKKLPLALKPEYTYDLIRLGNKNDGGYLIGSNTLSQVKCLLSFGIGLDLGFEIDFHNRTNKPIYSYDKNDFKFYFKNEFLLSLNNLRKLSIIDSLNVIKKFINTKKNKKIINFSKKLISYNTISNILSDFHIHDSLFIKIDIEGSEYRALDCIIKNQDKIIGLIVEFHDIDLHIEKIKYFINEINLKISHIHANNFGIPDSNGNPTVIEMTFEKDPEIVDKNVEIPNKNDFKNNPLKKDFIDYFDK